MGLWICSEDNKVTLWGGSYTGFFEFRKEVAAKIPATHTNHPAYEHFFDHSDCDGVWSPEECAAIRDFLHGEALLLLDDCENSRLIGFLDGLAYCASSKQNAVFL